MRIGWGRESPTRPDCADLQVYRSVGEMQETSFPGTGGWFQREMYGKSGNRVHDLAIFFAVDGDQSSGILIRQIHANNTCEFIVHFREVFHRVEMRNSAVPAFSDGLGGVT